MKLIPFFVAMLSAAITAVAQDIPVIPHNAAQDTEHIMSDAYWTKWNDSIQAGIDADIDRYRKADALFKTGRIKKGTTVKVEQISSEFVFGSSAFNWNQLGNKEANARYRELFGTLFNRATIPFYWRTFEVNPGIMRFRENVTDTEEWWNKTTRNIKMQPHWRRPPTDPIVDWCNSHNCAVHGHPLVWGSRTWHIPDWLQYEGIPVNERLAIDSLDHRVFAGSTVHCRSYYKMTPGQLAAAVPTYLSKMEESTNLRIEAIMKRYEGRIRSWDVVNESATDFSPNHKPEDPMWKTSYGMMYSDYTYKAFKKAASLDSGQALLNINDYWTVNDQYLRQVKDLVRRGCRIDVIGSQMHLFNPQECLDIAAGKTVGKLVDFDRIRTFFKSFEETGIPMCLSEITITSAGNGHRGEMIQAIITRNLYRAWFSTPNMMGITWWNIVDDCGAPGEPTISGLFHRDMTPKYAYHALRELILNEWRTREELIPDSHGSISWRGFCGTYRITWTDSKGKEHSESFTLGR